MLSWFEADVFSSRFRSSTHLMLLLLRVQNVLTDTHPPALDSRGGSKNNLSQPGVSVAAAENSTPDVAAAEFAGSVFNWPLN